MTATQISDIRTDDVQTDLREALARTQQWVVDLLASVTADQLPLPTPCAEFDVAALVRHLYGVADRVEAMGHGRPAASVPPFLARCPTTWPPGTGSARSARRRPGPTTRR